MLNTKFSPWPSFTEEEAEAVKQTILSNKVNYWTGQECREFEKEFAIVQILRSHTWQKGLTTFTYVDSKKTMSESNFEFLKYNFWLKLNK